MERAFGVLQVCFAIIHGPAPFRDKENLRRIMRACIILHNMIVKDERNTYAGNFDELPFYDDVDNIISQLELREETFASYERYIQNNI